MDIHIKTEKEIEMFCPASRQEWRQWLEQNHEANPSVWLVYYKKKTNKPTISWGEAVDEALCFGWIDSVKKTLDHETFMQFFSKRKPNSVWSKINKDKVQVLIAAGLMTKAGYRSIEIAQQNGSWAILDHAETLEIPEDLAQALKSRPGAHDFFLSLSKSSRKSILQWLLLAKRPETRQNRVNEVAQLAAQKQKPKQF